jgi:hypothetical protein
LDVAKKSSVKKSSKVKKDQKALIFSDSDQDIFENSSSNKQSNKTTSSDSEEFQEVE